MYNERILDIFTNLQNVGIVKKPSSIAIFKDENTADITKLTIKVEDGKITQAKFKAFGNVCAIVCAEVICNKLLNNFIVDVKKIKFADILADVGDIPQNKIKCIQNSEKIIKLLIDDYEKREAKRLKKMLNKV